jgi:two-component system chemotaxis response regulator CheY
MKKVLIIDDSISVRNEVSQALARAGFEVVEAVDGIDGANQIKNRADLSLVLCDINMPRLNGLDMLDSVKDEISTRSLPVLMLTTEGEPSAMVRAKRSGAKGWIVKPFVENMLVSAVKKLTAVS